MTKISKKGANFAKKSFVCASVKKEDDLASLSQSRSPAMIASGEFRVMIAFGKL